MRVEHLLRILGAEDAAELVQAVGLPVQVDGEDREAEEGHVEEGGLGLESDIGSFIAAATSVTLGNALENDRLIWMQRDLATQVANSSLGSADPVSILRLIPASLGEHRHFRHCSLRQPRIVANLANLMRLFATA